MLDLAAITEAYRTGRIEPHHVAALLSELDRLTSELAAAQPVVEWRHLPGSAGWERADVGQFSLLLMGDSAWRLICGDQAVIARGSPGGDAGKAAAVAAYRRACGLTPQAAPVAPQVVRLHQAYEGTTVCLHCGKPMPWSEMEVCPRDSGFPTAPPCAG